MFRRELPWSALDETGQGRPCAIAGRVHVVARADHQRLPTHVATPGAGEKRDFVNKSTRMKRANVVLVLSLAACTSWRVQTDPVPEALPQGGKPRTIRVLLRSGQRVELFDAALSGDSIIGFSRPEQQTVAQRVAVAAADVAQLEFKHSNPILSALGMAGIGVGVLVLVSAVVCAAAVAA